MTERKCDGGCGKTVTNEHPKAGVLCLACAMEETKNARETFHAFLATLPGNN